jgi:ADP-heptose:LPS heptosyltransferase
MKKTLVIIAARGIGDLIYHLPLLRSLHESYKEKLIILSNKVNHSKEVYKFETFYKEIIEFENTRFSFFKTLKKINNLKNIINKCNVDQLILTASSRRLMTPVYLSDVKEKIILVQVKFFFTKDNEFQHLTHADKIMRYTEHLNLSIKVKNFFLTQPNLKNIDNFKKKNRIFINIDSHHDQNNWNMKNYIKIIFQLLSYNINVYINFSPSKLHFLKLLPKEIINSNKVVLTHNKTISEIIQIINLSDSVIGNESGPICLAASFKKEVHSIYLPIHTKPESQIISNKTIYYNTEKESDKTIINKIMNNLLTKFHKL